MKSSYVSPLLLIFISIHLTAITRMINLFCTGYLSPRMLAITKMINLSCTGYLSPRMNTRRRVFCITCNLKVNLCAAINQPCPTHNGIILTPPPQERTRIVIPINSSLPQISPISASKSPDSPVKKPQLRYHLRLLTSQHHPCTSWYHNLLQTLRVN